jgi:hypothetical protein
MRVKEFRVTGIGQGDRPVIHASITVGGFRFYNCRVYLDRHGRKRVGFPQRRNTRPMELRKEGERDVNEMCYPVDRVLRDDIDAQVLELLDAAIATYRRNKPPETSAA